MIRRMSSLFSGSLLPGHRFGMLDTNRLFAGEDESQTIPGLGGDIRLVIPSCDIVLQLAFLRDQRRFLFFQSVKLCQIQRIGMECRCQLDGSQSHDEQCHEERDRRRRRCDGFFRAFELIATKIPVAFDLEHDGYFYVNAFMMRWLRSLSDVLLAGLESAVAGVLSGGAELLLNLEQAVVLGDTLATSRGTGLNLAGVLCHSQVGDGGIRGLAGTGGKPWR